MYQVKELVEIGKQIIVLHRGWVLIGNVTIDGDIVHITDCGNIRRWGTTKGLGEIAKSGPTDETVIDPQPSTRVHILSVIQFIECEV